MMVSPQIAEKPAFVVVGLETTFLHALSPKATNVEVIGPLWETFFSRMEEVRHRHGHVMYGVIYARPEAKRTHRDELQYLAGVVVTDEGGVPEGMVAHTVPAGTFAVFTHRGSIKKIVETVRDIYREWLPTSGYRHAGTADVELYDHRFCLDSDDSEMEYWIPLASQA